VDLTGSEHVGKLERLPRYLRLAVWVGVRPLFENSTVCQKIDAKIPVLLWVRILAGGFPFVGVVGVGVCSWTVFLWL
jgi:hypothetical protein